MWDERYSSETYVYGTEPNEFLVANVGQLPKGRILCLAEGEGRNAVWLARQGYHVTAVDASAVGLAKARRLAAAHDVEIEAIHADLTHFELGENRWDGIVSIFCHLPPALRAKVHAAVVAALKPGGVLLLEAYTPRQLQFRTGGPPTAEMMMTLESLTEELRGLAFRHALELEREVHEGTFHHGRGAVVQLIAVKEETGTGNG
ncbi:MAG: methyltransferase domain-containing protein [Gammaproteobacteria bacterium]